MTRTPAVPDVTDLRRVLDGRWAHVRDDTCALALEIE